MTPAAGALDAVPPSIASLATGSGLPAMASFGSTGGAGGHQQHGLAFETPAPLCGLQVPPGPPQKAGGQQQLEGLHRASSGRHLFSS